MHSECVGTDQIPHSPLDAARPDLAVPDLMSSLVDYLMDPPAMCSFGEDLDSVLPIESRMNERVSRLASELPLPISEIPSPR